MNLIITGAAGFIGKKLTKALLERSYLVGSDGRKNEIESLTLLDITEPEDLPEDERIRVHTGDISDPSFPREFIGPEADGVFHLAAVVSADAEENFDLGMRVNVDGTRNVLEACRQQETNPRLVFTSSIAVFGGELPSVIEDSYYLSPQNSYGIQKAIGELLVQDYTRKGFVEGRTLRLPTVVIRPGKPNRAASTFASSIIRDTLQGDSAVCPVETDARMYIASPRRIVEGLVHGFELSPEVVGTTTSFMLPGISVTVGDMMESLEKFGGREAVDRIEWKPNERIKNIVLGWPGDFNPQRAIKLGFKADESMDAIVQAFLEDDIVKE
ncbi:MAG: D-erythronate dehydrogenase [Spirochaetaceae bacterium]